MTLGSNSPSSSSRNVKELVQGLRILLLDVDGVMTDGGIILIGADLEAKRFDVQDGMGISLLRSSGLMTGIVTSRSSEVVQRRAKELGMEELFQGVRHKPQVLEQLREKYGIEPSQAAFVGDDIQDVPIMRLVGVPIAVQNAIPEVKEASVYVTNAQGGHGAIREVAEWLLDLRGDREQVYRQITGQEPVPQG